MSQSTISSATTSRSSRLLSQAQQWFRQANVSKTLGQVPTSLKSVGTRTATRFNSLSTTQKVVGGAVLALGVGYLARRGQSTSRKGTTQADTLQELLHFVNDRIEGYKRAVEESQDNALRGYYKQLVSQSQQFATDLNNHLREQGADLETDTTLKGKLYRAWMDAKAAITGSDEKAILGSNIYGEEWALKAYRDALQDETLTGKLRLEVQRQYFQSQKTYKHLKQLAAKQQS
jgi:uncharacterized protein (TIGR02284 family)